MSYNTPMSEKESVLERLLQPLQGDLPPDFARKLLSLDFTEAEHALYRDLSEKAQLGQLTAEESGKLDELLTANDLLMILQCKARVSLKNSPSAA
jgi:hypothetical protein